MLNKENYFKQNKGFTLIELLVIIPIIAVILLISYNILFLSTKSYNYVSDTFNSTEDIRLFINNIQKEVAQAKKAVEDKTVIYKPSNSNNKVLHIYSDIDNDDIPELIRYRLDNNVIKRDYKKAKNNNYPYKYNSSFIGEKIVLSNVVNQDIFGEVTFINTEQEKTEQEKYGEKDNRRKVRMTIEISTGSNNTPIIIDTYLVTKSRTESE